MKYYNKKMVLGILVITAFILSGCPDQKKEVTGHFLSTEENSAQLVKSIFKWEYSLDTKKGINGKASLEILRPDGSARNTYTFDFDPRAINPIVDKEKTIYRVISSANEDFEVEAEIIVVEILYSKKEYNYLNHYKKIVSKVVLNYISIIANPANNKRLIGVYNGEYKELLSSEFIPQPSITPATPEMAPANPLRRNPKNFKE